MSDQDDERPSQSRRATRLMLALSAMLSFKDRNDEAGFDVAADSAIAEALALLGGVACDIEKMVKLLEKISSELHE